MLRVVAIPPFRGPTDTVRTRTIPVMEQRARPTGRRLLAGVGVALGFWLLAALLALVLAARDARSGLAHLEEARSTLSAEGLVAGEGTDLLVAARVDFARARARTESFLLGPIRAIPGLGDQIRAAGALTGAASDVLDVGLSAVAGASDAVEEARAGGMERVTALRRMAEVAAEASGRLARVDLGSDRSLTAPLAGAHRRFDERLGELRDAVTDLEDAAYGFADFLEGPRTYLLFAANNNEMRIGSGTFLSVGLLTVRDGELELSPMAPTGYMLLRPEQAERVEMEPDFAAMWGWIHPNREWRNLAASPRFDVTARLAVRMAEARTPGAGRFLDGVIALDPVALGALVEATGAIEIGDQKIEGSQVAPLLMLVQYLDVKGFDDPQAERREGLSQLARLAIDRLDSGRWEPAELVGELSEAVAGRHFLAWSRHASEEAAWRAAGVSGEVGGSSLVFGLHNRGGNKLDQFVEARGSVEVTPDAGGTDVVVDVHLENRTPKGLPAYVVGPYPKAVGAGEGVYQGIAVFELPAGAEVQEMRDLGWGVERGRDGPLQVATTYVKLRRDEHADLRLRFRLPAGSEELTVEPSARVPAVSWSSGGATWQDTEPRELRWSLPRHEG